MSATVQERAMVRVVGAARPSAAEYADTLGAWAGAFQDAGGGLMPPRRLEPVYADAEGKPMVVRPGWDGPTAFPFPGAMPEPSGDPRGAGFVGLADGNGYGAAAAAGLAEQAATNSGGHLLPGGDGPDDGGVFGDLKQQIGGYLQGLPAQAAQSLLKTALTNAMLGGTSGLGQALAGGLGGLVPGLGGAAGTLGSVLGGLTDGAGPLGGVVGSLTGGCFGAGPGGIAFDSSAALSQLGGQLLGKWQVQDSDSMGEQLAHHFVNKYADQLKDPQAALDKLKGYFTGAVAAAEFPAARLSDADSVGDPVLAGAATVLVEGLPQARIGDPVRPPGVAVYMGAATVLTEGRMSARAGTSVTQAGPIPKGAATVFINGAPGGAPPPKPPPAPPKQQPAAAPQKPAAAPPKGPAGAAGAAGQLGKQPDASPSPAGPPATPPAASGPAPDGTATPTPTPEPTSAPQPQPAPTPGAATDQPPAAPTATPTPPAPDSPADKLSEAGDKIGATGEGLKGGAEKLEAANKATAVQQAKDVAAGLQSHADGATGLANEAKAVAQADAQTARGLASGAETSRDVADAQRAFQTAAESERRAGQLGSLANTAQAEAKTAASAVDAVGDGATAWTKGATTIGKYAGPVATGITVGVTAYKADDAYGRGCNAEAVQEVGRGVGNIGGGAAGAAGGTMAAGVVCTAIGIGTAGIGGFVCAAVVIGGSAYAGGKVGEAAVGAAAGALPVTNSPDGVNCK